MQTLSDPFSRKWPKSTNFDIQSLIEFFLQKPHCVTFAPLWYHNELENTNERSLKYLKKDRQMKRHGGDGKQQNSLNYYDGWRVTLLGGHTEQWGWSLLARSGKSRVNINILHLIDDIVLPSFCFLCVRALGFLGILVKASLSHIGKVAFCWE